MTPSPLDDYLNRLERELRERGVEDARIVEEAREHLVDAVEDGRQRGLSVGDAARDAVERFGAPEIVAAHVTSEKDRTMNRFAAVLDTVWHRKWWILAPTVLTAVLTSVVSYYFLPTRYRSESSILITRVPTDNVRPTDTGRSRARFQEISASVLSRTRLEMIISEFRLYQAEQDSASRDELVQQMRRDIGVNVLTSDSQNDEVSGVNVSFVSSEPELAMKITERLASLIIEENVRQSDTQAEGATIQFIDSQIDDVRTRIIAYEKTLEALRAQNGRRPLSQADLLPYEVLKERYKALLIKSEEARLVANLERRQIGERFRIIDPPRLPERPVGPSRIAVNVAGTLAGLGLGLVVVGVRGRSKKTSG
jgi:uncharacterized protein involved in exopolysaccharide biosynthesis